MTDLTKKEEALSGAGKIPISPYLLTSHDNPGNIITQVQLKGENFEEWSRAVRNALRAKKKYGFVDGSIQRPAEDSPDLEDWWTVNSMIVSWIFNTIEGSLRSTISHKEIASDLWNDIRQRFAIGNGPRAHQLKSDIASCKQKGEPIVKYFGRLSKLWDELNDFEQILSCCCNGCTCDIGAKLERQREVERLHQFLMGLDHDSYGSVRSSILNFEPPPNVNRAYSLVIQEERMRSISQGTSEKPDPMSFTTRAGGKQRNTTREKKDANTVCSHCNRKGHAKSGCFLLNGFPDWWGDRPRTVGRGSGMDTGGGREQQPKLTTFRLGAQILLWAWRGKRLLKVSLQNN